MQSASKITEKTLSSVRKIRPLRSYCFYRIQIRLSNFLCPRNRKTSWIFM